MLYVFVYFKLTFILGLIWVFRLTGTFVSVVWPMVFSFVHTIVIQKWLVIRPLILEFPLVSIKRHNMVLVDDEDEHAIETDRNNINKC